MQLEELLAGLGPKEYETKTRGKRRVEAAHALGEGAPSVFGRLLYILKGTIGQPGHEKRWCVCKNKVPSVWHTHPRVQQAIRS